MHSHNGYFRYTYLFYNFFQSIASKIQLGFIGAMLHLVQSMLNSKLTSIRSSDLLSPNTLQRLAAFADVEHKL